MALFTDRPINTLENLKRYESSLLNVASTEQIDLIAKMALAKEQIAADVLLFLLRYGSGSYDGWIGGYQDEQRRRALGVSDVVVTAPLERWHAFTTIALAYEDAYNNQLNDRYQGKWTQYTELAQNAAVQYFRIGVGLANDPISRAGTPVLTQHTGQQGGNTYYVRMSWTNQEGQEGAVSEPVTLTTTDYSVLSVSAAPAPANAAGWNVYAGTGPETTTLQNATPLPVSAIWTVPAQGLQNGRLAGWGQAPDRYVVNRQKLQRG